MPISTPTFVWQGAQPILFPSLHPAWLSPFPDLQRPERRKYSTQTHQVIKHQIGREANEFQVHQDHQDRPPAITGCVPRSEQKLYFGNAWNISPTSQILASGATSEFSLPLWMGLEVTNAVATFSIEGEWLAETLNTLADSLPDVVFRHLPTSMAQKFLRMRQIAGVSRCLRPNILKLKVHARQCPGLVEA